jgi:hypothetical protein
LRSLDAMPKDRLDAIEELDFEHGPLHEVAVELHPLEVVDGIFAALGPRDEMVNGRVLAEPEVGATIGTARRLGVEESLECLPVPRRAEASDGTENWNRIVIRPVFPGLWG